MPLHYAVLASVSERYSPLEGRLLTCYSPVRHFIHSPKGVLIVRLACLRHAASVDSEPGSNSRWFPSSFFVYDKPKFAELVVLQINTWTRISSFQISTCFFSASSFTSKRNYWLYRSDFVCQPRMNIFQLFLFSSWNEMSWGKYVFSTSEGGLSSVVRRIETDR